MEYDLPLFRPPSEARSLIFQVTLGCSWNRCRFCVSYGTKEFRMRPYEKAMGGGFRLIDREDSLLHPEVLARYSRSISSSCTFSIARPPRTYDGRTISGYPIRPVAPAIPGDSGSEAAAAGRGPAGGFAGTVDRLPR